MPITVSIVEDDCEARKVLVDWVRAEADFRLGSDHGSAESALPVLPREAPAIVLMDINLPGLNGVECVRQLKVLLPETQFVMLTVYEDAEHIFNALAAGATGYLLKHTPRAELLAALREVRAGGSPMASNIARRVVQSAPGHRIVRARTGGAGTPCRRLPLQGNRRAVEHQRRHGEYLYTPHLREAPGSLPRPGGGPLQPFLRPPGPLDPRPGHAARLSLVLGT